MNTPANSPSGPIIVLRGTGREPVPGVVDIQMQPVYRHYPVYYHMLGDQLVLKTRWAYEPINQTAQSARGRRVNLEAVVASVQMPASPSPRKKRGPPAEWSIAEFMPRMKWGAQ